VGVNGRRGRRVSGVTGLSGNGVESDEATTTQIKLVILKADDRQIVWSFDQKQKGVPERFGKDARYLISQRNPPYRDEQEQSPNEAGENLIDISTPFYQLFFFRRKYRNLDAEGWEDND